MPAAAQAHDSGLASTDSVLGIPYCPVHGVVVACRAQALPQHAPIYLHGQVQGGRRGRQLRTLRSTLISRSLQDEKKRKLLKVRLEMAKFLQETIRETGIKSPDKIKESEEFKEFFRKVSARRAGHGSDHH